MGPDGDACDDAACDSLSATLGCEPPDGRRFATGAAARMAVCEPVEGWHHPGRRHSALGHGSPVAFERRARNQLESATGWTCPVLPPVTWERHSPSGRPAMADGHGDEVKRDAVRSHSPAG